MSRHNADTRLVPPRYEPVYLGLAYADREEMKRIIDLRVDRMVAQGLFDEVRALVESGVPRTDEFPFPVLLDQAKPVTEYVPGWNCDISGVRTWEELPQAARDYVEYVERAIGCRIGYVSVGAERDSLIVR